MSAVEKDGESGGRFPTVRHAHFLGLIGRSHSLAQAKVEEIEDRRWLDWDRGTLARLGVGEGRTQTG